MKKKVKESIRSSWIAYVLSLQEEICQALEMEDGSAQFHTDEWKRKEGGGGKTRVISDGDMIEKGGVNSSVVEGKVTDSMKKHLHIEGDYWFACGLSLIIHPQNPFVPTVHANYRYFELYDEQENVIDRWFGGGTDLTPYYLFEKDAKHFHETLKAACDPYGKTLYPKFKEKCDQYFNNKHRGFEARGIGGIFYDYLRPGEEMTLEQLLAFQKANGDSFLEAYLPIVRKRKEIEWNKKNKKWQEIRRGRYVEFNLIHDRGTLFGLKSGGRIESILVSLPPTVRFDYDDQPEKGSEEERMLKIYKAPRSWISIGNKVGR